MGASLLPVPSALEISVTTGLMAPPEVAAKPVMVTAIPAHDLSLLLIQTNKTMRLMKVPIKELSSQLLQASTSISSPLLDEKQVTEETQNSCSPLCAAIVSSACLLLPQ